MAYPTDHFKIPESQNPPIYVSELHNIRFGGSKIVQC